jgi:hypothetical protein
MRPAVRQRNALRGVRLVVYDSVADCIRRSDEPNRRGEDSAMTAPLY